MKNFEEYLDEMNCELDLNEIEAHQTRKTNEQADRVSPRRPLDPSQGFTWDIPDNDESDFDHE